LNVGLVDFKALGVGDYDVDNRKRHTLAYGVLGLGSVFCATTVGTAPRTRNATPAARLCRDAGPGATGEADHAGVSIKLWRMI
jgi:hypothetical protein